MEKIVKKLLVFFVILVSAFVFLFVNESKVYALTPNYNGTSNEIYYFADSKPVLNNNTFNNYFGGSSYSIVYDVPYFVDDNTLRNMYNNGYFQGFAQDTIVIFDLKTRLIDGVLLNTIFYDIQQLQGCKIIFISGFSDSQYNDDIHQFINYYLETTNHITFEEYVHMSVDDIIQSHNSVSPIIIIVDSRFCDINDWQNSIYMQLMLDELWMYYLNTSPLNANFGDYDEILLELESNGLVYFIINTTIDNYSIINGYESNIIDYYLLEEYIVNNISNECTLINCYAMGIFKLRIDMYNLLSSCWNGYGYAIPTYVWVIDDLTGGLPVISDSQLALENGYEIIIDYEVLDNLLVILSNAIYS